MTHVTVEVGHAENLRQAFTQNLYDGRPAYSVGNEPKTKIVKLILHQSLKSLSSHEFHAHVVIMHEHVANSLPIFQFASKLSLNSSHRSLLICPPPSTYSLLHIHHFPILHHSYPHLSYPLLAADPTQTLNTCLSYPLNPLLSLHSPFIPPPNPLFSLPPPLIPPFAPQ